MMFGAFEFQLVQGLFVFFLHNPGFGEPFFRARFFQGSLFHALGSWNFLPVLEAPIHAHFALTPEWLLLQCSWTHPEPETPHPGVHLFGPPVHYTEPCLFHAQGTCVRCYGMVLFAAGCRAQKCLKHLVIQPEPDTRGTATGAIRSYVSGLIRSWNWKSVHKAWDKTHLL